MATFEQAIKAVLDAEGGHVDDPDDPGGETKYGISSRRYPDVDVAALTREQAVALYRRDFWNPLYEKIDAQPIATKLLTLTLNLPHGDARPYYETSMRGIRLVQEAVRSLGDREITIDGLFGPQTLQALRLGRPACLLAAIRVEQCRYYLALADETPALRKFLRGWVRRALA